MVPVGAFVWQSRKIGYEGRSWAPVKGGEVVGCKVGCEPVTPRIVVFSKSTRSLPRIDELHVDDDRAFVLYGKVYKITLDCR